MRQMIWFLGVGLVSSLAEAGELKIRAATNPVQLTTISLTDQNNQPHVFAFPQPAVSVLTVADHKGSAQIESWVRAVTTRYATNVLIEGVADVSSVPAPLRPLIRKRFRAAFAHPVMLDWKGRVVQQLEAAPDLANVYALSTNGVVLLSLRGAVDEEKLSRLFVVLDARESRVQKTNQIAAAPVTITQP